MHQTHRVRNLYLLTAIVLIASCDLDGAEISPATDMSTKALAAGDLASYERSQLDAEARDLYNELVGRLAARGVTPAEVEAAAESGDEEVVRELFGYTPEELDHQYERLVALGREVERTGSGRSGEPPMGAPDRPPEQERFFKCHPGLSLCALAAAERAMHHPNEIGLAIFVIGGLGCVWVSCQMDGPGTWTSRP